MNKIARKKGDSVLLMTGCMVNNYSKDLSRFENVDYFVENAQKKSILNIVDAHFRGETIDPEALIPDVFGFNPAKKTFHTRSMIKIQDGCDNFCTYCIVPKVRGRAISRPVKDIIENIHKVLDYGYKEIVLTGVNIGRYQYEQVNFEKLVEEILAIPGDFRVRISSIEPEGFGDRLFELFEHPKLTQHLHLCIQSGSDKTLLLMRRFYTLKDFLDMIDKIKARYNHFNLTTDIIVGFPGETGEEFLESVKVAKDVGFSHIHTFKYSVRNGTRAARMPGQINNKVKNERSKIIREISAENKRIYRKSLIGLSQRMLVEQINKNGFVKGYGELYVPIKVKTKDMLQNEFYNVKLSDFEESADLTLIANAL
jgi:threonylcarbamoyladenosine tRNA methylthiotransferase MtaB